MRFAELFAHRGLSIQDLINYRYHPIDCVPKVIKNRVPIFLICGDSDHIVPYAENGALLHRMYTEAGAPVYHILMTGCDHHPHGLEDNTPLIAAVEESYAS